MSLIMSLMTLNNLTLCMYSPLGMFPVAHGVLDVSPLYLNADISFGFNALGGGGFSFADLAKNTGEGEYAFPFHVRTETCLQ